MPIAESGSIASPDFIVFLLQASQVISHPELQRSPAASKPNPQSRFSHDDLVAYMQWFATRAIQVSAVSHSFSVNRELAVVAREDLKAAAAGQVSVYDA
jgi:hypothetical protein